MPLGLKLRKAHKSYDVLSKNLFVCMVELLDNSVLECSLNADSSGQECVEHVCQRLGIDEADYFGMKFVNKRLQYQWLDPDQSVKSQLERLAQDPTLYFAVQFYVTTIYQVKDEMARYQYFLQLRNDVIEGKLMASPETSILLAAYSLQAAYGDYEPHQHTLEHLQNYLLLPKSMVGNEEISSQMLQEVLNLYEKLRGTSPSLSELYYIFEAQKLDGYGDESYAAKDASGNDLLLAFNLSGICIFRIPHSRPVITIQWQDLNNISVNKKAICLECAGTGRASKRMVHVYMEDMENAKYLCQMMQLQKEFHLTVYDTQIPANIIPEQYLATPANSMVQVESTVSSTSFTPSNTQYTSNNGYEQHTNGSHFSYHLAEQPHDVSSRNVNSTAISHSNRHVLSTSSNSTSIHKPVLSSEIKTSSSNNARVSVSNTHFRAPAEDAMPSLAAAAQQELCDFTSVSGSGVTPVNIISNSRKPAVLPRNLRAAQPTEEMLSENMSEMYMKNHLPARNSVLDTARKEEFFAAEEEFISQNETCVDGVRFLQANINDAEILAGSTPNLAAQLQINNNIQQKNIHNVVSNSTPEIYSNFESQLSKFSGKENVLPSDDEEMFPINEVKNSDAFNQMDPAETFRSQTSSATSSNTSFAENQPQLGTAPAANRPTSFNTPDKILLSTQKSSLEYSPTDRAISIASQSPLEDTKPPVDMPFNGNNNHSFDALAGEDFESTADSNDEIDLTSSPGPLKLAEMTGLTLSRMQLGLNGSASPYSSSSGSGNLKKIGSLSSGGSKFTEKGVRNSINSSHLSQVVGEKEDRLAKGVKQRFENVLLLSEFEQLPKKRIQKCVTSVATMPENAERNRFRDVLPYDDTRIKLEPTKLNRKGYINASEIILQAGESLTDSSTAVERRYIATQAPLPVTFIDFFQMLWMYNVKVVIQLSDNGIHSYLPGEKKNEKVRVGPFILRRMSCQRSDGWTTSMLELNNGGKKLQFWHFQFYDWPENALPAVDKFVNLMHEVSCVHREAHANLRADSPPPSPIVVHCSSGVGRSGVAVLFDFVSNCLNREVLVEVPRILNHMRIQRPFMIPSIKFYRFVYNALRYHVESNRLI